MHKRQRSLQNKGCRNSVLVNLKRRKTLKRGSKNFPQWRPWILEKTKQHWKKEEKSLEEWKLSLLTVHCLKNERKSLDRMILIWMMRYRKARTDRIIGEITLKEASPTTIRAGTVTIIKTKDLRDDDDSLNN